MSLTEQRTELVWHLSGARDWVEDAGFPGSKEYRKAVESEKSEEAALEAFDVEHPEIKAAKDAEISAKIAGSNKWI